MSMTAEEIERQQAVTNETKALQTAFAEFHKTGVKFSGSDAEVLAKFKETGHEIFIEDGVAFTKFDSEILKVEDALLRHAFDAPQGEVDRRTLPRGGVGTSRSSTLCKSEMTTAEKVKYVNEFGEEAFAALPITHVQTGEVRTIEDFRRLPLAEKVRLTNADPDFVAKLKPSPGVRMPGQAFINQIALEKIAAIRPASRRTGVATAR